MARTHEELSRMNVPAAEFQQHYTSRPASHHPSFPDVVQARAVRRAHLDRLVQHMPIPSAIPDAVKEKEVHVRAEDGFSIPVTVYAPTRSLELAGVPVVILLHEGGWHLGDRKDEEMNARWFVRDLDCVVLNVEYRLGPEHPFPASVLDCYAVLQFLAQEPQHFDVRANPKLGIVLGGSSAGGNLAAVLAHKARADQLDPPVTGQWLSVAALLSEELCPEKYWSEYVSGTENQDDPVIGKLSTEAWDELCAQIQIPKDDSLFTPFASSIYPPLPDEVDKEPKLAKAFFQVAGMDPLRDHSLIYERALREDWNVATRLKVYNGYGHMFWTNWPEMEESRRFWSDMVEGMKWLLGP